MARLFKFLGPRRGFCLHTHECPQRLMLCAPFSLISAVAAAKARLASWPPNTVEQTHDHFRRSGTTRLARLLKAPVEQHEQAVRERARHAQHDAGPERRVQRLARPRARAQRDGRIRRPLGMRRGSA